MIGSPKSQVVPSLLLSIQILPPMQKELTSIKISKETRDNLATLGTLKDSYDTVISRLIEKSGGRA